MIVSTAEEMNPSRRNTMEDAIVTHGPEFFARGGAMAPSCENNVLSSQEDGNGGMSSSCSWNLFGVYDGHGGREIVDYLDVHLAHNVAQELRNRHQQQSTNKEHSNIEDDDDATVLQRLERAFLLTDIQSYMAGIRTSGATVVMCVIQHHPNNIISLPRQPPPPSPTTRRRRRATIYTANCGDARAVLCDGKGVVTRLSHDHKADDPKEIARIEASGGFVLRGRVLGILAVARSLGDHGLKDYVIGRPHLSQLDVDIDIGIDHDVDFNDGEHGNEQEEEDLVLEDLEDILSNDTKSSNHNRKRRRVAPQGHNTTGPFVILACDGLWDVLKDQTAVDLVNQYLTTNAAKKSDYLVPEKKVSKNGIDDIINAEEEHDNRNKNRQQEKVAQMLVDEAMKRGSTDNISVVVTWL